MLTHLSSAPLVNKIRRGEGLRKGTVVDVDADFFVDYSFGTFCFTRQIVIDSRVNGQDNSVFATVGDSGSIVVDQKQRAIGVVFAEPDRFVLACPLSATRKWLQDKIGGDLTLLIK